MRSRLTTIFAVLVLILSQRGISAELTGTWSASTAEHTRLFWKCYPSDFKRMIKIADESRASTAPTFDYYVFCTEYRASFIFSPPGNPYFEWVIRSHEEQLESQKLNDHIARALSGRRQCSIYDRIIVTRNHDTNTPTWDGRIPAFIIEPLIWHFDPESNVYKMRLWPPSRNDATALQSDTHAVRRTLLEFMLEMDRMPRERRWFGDRS